MSISECYRRFEAGQVVRIKVKKGFGADAGTLAVIRSVDDGRSHTVSTVPISVVLLRKDGRVSRRTSNQWFSFTADEVEIVHTNHAEWLKKPADLFKDLDALLLRYAEKMNIPRHDAVYRFVKRLQR